MLSGSLNYFYITPSDWLNYLDTMLSDWLYYLDTMPSDWLNYLDTMPSDWLVYTEMTRMGRNAYVKGVTFVSAAVVALLAGTY